MQLVAYGSQDMLLPRYTKEVHPIVMKAMEAIVDHNLENLKQQCTILNVCMQKARRTAKIYESSTTVMKDVVRAFDDLAKKSATKGNVTALEHVLGCHASVGGKKRNMVDLYRCAINCSNPSNGVACMEFIHQYGIIPSGEQQSNLVKSVLDTATANIAYIEYVVHAFGLVWHATPRDTVKCVRRGVDVVQAVMRLAASVTWSDDGQECCTAVRCIRADCLKFIVENGATWNDEVCKRVVILAIYYESVECLEFAIDKCSDFALLATELKTEGLPAVLESCYNRTHRTHRYIYYSDDSTDSTDSDDSGDDSRSSSDSDSDSSTDSPESSSTGEDDPLQTLNKDDLCDMAARFGDVDVLRLLHVKAGHPIHRRALVRSSTPKCFSYVLDALEAGTPWDAEQVWEGRDGKTLINDSFSSKWR